MDTDRLSSLPDELIYQILSFLPWTKHSVQTSVLSKRWRFLWTCVPFLVFDDDDTRRADTITKIVLQQHKHDIHTFFISIEDHYDQIEDFISIEDHDDQIEEEFQSWIVNVTTRNIRKLVVVQKDLYINLNLPQCLFTCRTLVDLSLKGCGGIPVGGIYFPALKKLKLDFAELISSESLPQFISGCPVLEELSVTEVLLGGHCCVSSPTLTKLVFQLDSYISDIRVNLDTPALRYLRLFTSTCDEVSVGALDNLIEADIYSINELAFVGNLNNVKLLSLHIDHISVINESTFFASGIKFHNLTKLHLCAHLGFMAFFLGNANNLRVLKIGVFDCMEDHDGYGWKEPEQVPACLRSHLQTFELDLNWLYGKSFKPVYDMVRYILVNGKVLKRMKVPRRGIPKKKLKPFKRAVALFERGSQECELVYYIDYPSL